MDKDLDDKYLDRSDLGLYDVSIPDNNESHYSDISIIQSDRLNPFSDISKDLLSNSRLRFFIEKFNDVLNNLNLDDIVFSKFTAKIDETDNSILLEWIYNYYRAIVIFDDSDCDMYGLIITNPIDKIYKTELRPLVEGEYEASCVEIIKFVLQNM
jgi:hypothetical protein